ncbi:MAG: response regulator, partial [Tatlockia sp.]|nr:response regulator [Tatlockia sp.]
VCLSVSDTGIGISSEDQTKLFNAFNQADTTITRRFGGSGLGLVISKKLVEEMGGRITLSSELYKGSTFAAQIKVEKLASYEVEKHQSQRFDHLKVLCFDDNPLYLDAMCNGLGYWGIESIRVNTFNKLEAAFKQHPECALAFINVNEGCEKQVAKVLRKQTISCVLVSKWVIPSPQLFGGCAFLFKPISIQKLQEVIESLLNQVSKNKATNHELDGLRSQLRLAHPEVLIAEDNPVNRMLLNFLLAELTNLEAVNNGEEALNACKSKRFNVILLDLQMPKINGLDAARLIRQESMLNKQTPIIVISANGSDLNNERLQKSGIDLWLQKPIDEKQLLNHLLSFIKKSKPIAIDWQLCVQKVSGNQDLAEEFLARFVEDLHKNREEFLQLLANEDIKGIEDAAHKLHGACCFCGVPHLQMQVIRLEKQAKHAKKIEELKKNFAELIQSIDEVIDEFNTLYQTSSSS